MSSRQAMLAKMPGITDMTPSPAALLHYQAGNTCCSATMRMQPCSATKQRPHAAPLPCGCNPAPLPSGDLMLLRYHADATLLRYPAETTHCSATMRMQPCSATATKRMQPCSATKRRLHAVPLPSGRNNAPLPSGHSTELVQSHTRCSRCQLCCHQHALAHPAPLPCGADA